MDTAQVIERLKNSKRVDVARATGLKYMWLSRVVWGDIKEPSSQKIDVLRDYFIKSQPSFPETPPTG